AAKWEHTRHLKFSKIIGDQRDRENALCELADIYIVSRDNVAWLSDYFGGHLPFDMLVLDELSSFKNNTSQRFKSLRVPRLTMKRVVGLTGTPVPNGLIDLWAQMWLLDMGKRLGTTITAYRKAYFKPEVQVGHIVYKYGLISGSEDLIKEKIGDICVSMKAEDYLELPDSIVEDVVLDMSDELYERYKTFEKEQVLQIIDGGEASPEDIGVTSATALGNKLLQYSSGFVYDVDKEPHYIHSIKLDALEDLVEQANGQSVLVAYNFVEDFNRIMERLKAYKPVVLEGKKDIDDWNAGKIQVMLAHPASTGYGLNLQEGGHIVIWYDLTWSLELYQQFNARINRQGQQHPVTIYRLIMNNTHEVDVAYALRQKNCTQNSLMESIKAKIKEYHNQWLDSMM
ncbi:MAG: DEAD/DEAH box helicase, partial [Prevotella sp.]|nr:DEAD/DEAH box helicase [Prevotella sp.]